MTRKRYKHIRFRVRELRTISLEGGWSEVDGLVPIRERPKPPAPLPEGAKLMVSENGDFVYFSNGKCWTCTLTPNEKKLVKAIIAAGDKVDSEEAFAAIWPGKAFDEVELRKLASGVNKRLKTQKMPVQLSISDGYAWIKPKTGI